MMFLDLIAITKDLILEERKQALLLENGPRYRYWTHSTPMEPSLSLDRPRQNASAQTELTTKAKIEVSHIVTMENVHDIFEALVESVSNEKQTEQKRNTGESVVKEAMMDGNNSAASILQVERKVNVL